MNEPDLERGDGPRKEVRCRRFPDPKSPHRFPGLIEADRVGHWYHPYGAAEAMA